MESKTYWDNKIIEWENSIQGRGSVGLIERIGSHFRGPVKYRAQRCLQILTPYVKSQTVLDLGCGSGFFDFELQHKAAPRHITGIDISGRAVMRARELAAQKNLSQQMTFLSGDINTIELPHAQVTIGLGFFDYLTLPEITTIFKNIKTKYFLFSFVENKVSLFRYMHILYLWTQQCPKHFYYSKDQIRQCYEPNWKSVRFINDPALSFACLVHNLPEVN